MPITEDELKKLNPKAKLTAQAKKEFGETFDCREAGYILEDGSMLDLSGKKEGGTAHTRSYDHRDICRAIDHGEKGIGGTEAMIFFEKQANALRFGTYGTWERGHDVIVQINTDQNPTPAQWNRIKRCCILHKIEALNYDVYDDKDNRVVSETIENPDCGKAIETVKKSLDKVREEPKFRGHEAEFTAEEKGLIELTAERGERLDIPGVCIENAAFMRLRDEGIVKASPGEPVEQGRICHWSLTEKGKSLAKELDYKIKSDNPSNPQL